MVLQLGTHIKDIHNVLITDETLLKLLFYKAKNMNDDVTKTGARPNILGSKSPLVSGIGGAKEMNAAEIISDVIKSTPKTNDLNMENAKCRVCHYLENTEKIVTNGSTSFTNAFQNLTFDVYVHTDYDASDFRATKVVDRISNLIHNKAITGIGKMSFEGIDRLDDGLKEGFEGYIGYRMKFRFMLLL
ncbi:hypothetical protein [Psychrobacillus sp. BM2]|uniref:hypothetical protein n=1 Tax=Psychrobacillus sp. BM2 TaxID=3400421 RepID=UPI003B0187A6